MVPVWRALFFSVLLAGSAASSEAVTLGIAWDPSPDSSVSGYRVYVGPAPGQHTESFDVGRVQASFFYTTAVSGRRYYFAVSALANGVTGPKSAEVSAVAGGLAIGGDPPAAPPQSLLGPPTNIPPDYWLNYSAGRRSLEDRTVPASVAAGMVAAGLAEISSVTVLPTGGGLLVESGATVRAFSDQGVEGSVAFQAPGGTRIAAVAADPRFATTGFVFVAEARQTPDGSEEVFVVRHRLLGGALGESAAVVAGRRQPIGAVAGLAITREGEVVLVQGDERALAWDDLRGGLWSVGPATPSTLAFSFSSPRATDMHAVGGLVEPVADGVVSAAVAVLDGEVSVALASPTTVYRFDVAASRLSAGTSVADRGSVVSVVSASTNVDYVVVREPAAGGTPESFALLRIQHADLP